MNLEDRPDVEREMTETLGRSFRVLQDRARLLLIKIEWTSFKALYLSGRHSTS